MVTVKLVNITKVFKGGVVGVKDINLTIEHGEFMALLGPSGSGKSTTLYLIAGIYKPTRGRIYFDDKDVTDLPPKDRNVGLVFQNWALYPHMKVYDNIAFPLRLKRVVENEIRERVLRVAKMLRIDKLLDRYPWQLSGGQQQRVAMARALVKEPDVLLLDEPMSNLDAVLRISVRAELKRLQRELGITTIYVTHDQAEALAMADRIALINDGRIVQIGTPSDIYNRPATIFVGGFIGNPPMNFLEADIEYRVDKPILIVDSSELDVPEHYRSVVEKLRLDKVVIGIRPEDIAIMDKPLPGRTIKAKIYAVEPMGRENIVLADVNGREVKIVVSKNLLLVEDKEAYLHPNPNKIVLFDPKTGKALELLI